LNITGINVQKTTYPEIQKNISLEPYNTLHVEAIAEQFVVITDPEQLSLLYVEGALGKEVWVLGGGSNVLFLGRVNQLVLKNEIRFLSIKKETDSYITIEVGGGNDWHELVTRCVNNSWGGIENLALIPGTVGAAPIQNIGAYGVEVKDVFVSLNAFDLETGAYRIFNRYDCEFGYRDSVFKRELKGRYIILSVTLKLKKPPHNINYEYKSLEKWLKTHNIMKPGIKDIFRGVVEIRTEKLPDPADLGNAGSFFKNPVLPEVKLDELNKRFKKVPSFPYGDSKVKIPAGWLIEQTGWKGRRIGDVGTYKNQALVIVNHGEATGEEIWNLALKIRNSVKNEFGIELVPEVNVVGSAYGL
jgi:UDP-N-acetylmuramate dehydrogenase